LLLGVDLRVDNKTHTHTHTHIYIYIYIYIYICLCAHNMVTIPGSLVNMILGGGAI
jgi:hypothetical protein